MTTAGRPTFAWHGERAVCRRAALATAVGLALSLSRGAPAAVPAVMLEYRTPSLLFWKTYHQAIREYIQKNILD
jgi:hypothetical protein